MIKPSIPKIMSIQISNTATEINLFDVRDFSIFCQNAYSISFDGTNYVNIPQGISLTWTELNQPKITFYLKSDVESEAIIIMSTY